MQKRLSFIRVIYFIVVFLIVLRLGFWQIVKSDELSAKAEGQRVLEKRSVGGRGDILFSDRSILASTQPAYLVFVQPQIIKGRKNLSDNELKIYLKDYAKSVANILWPVSNMVSKIEIESSDPAVLKVLDQKKANFESEIFNKLNQDLFWVSLGQRVNLETRKRLEDLNLVGLGFDQEYSRFYPEGSSSAHLLGFVGSNAFGDATGYFGLEGFYDGELKGKKGLQVLEKDAMGLPILIGKFFNQDAQKGKTLLLNIDRTVQHFVEEKLQKGLEKYGAKGVSAVVMEPKTGNVIAMASFPAYDPAEPSEFPKENFRNPITADGYEPGSTFKVLVMSAAINEGSVNPETVCDSCSGPINIGGFVIKTWNNKYQEKLTMTDTIIYSDNIGMVFVSKKLGIDKLYSYIKRFGFGEISGVDLQDEQSPDLRGKNEWKEIDQATASFGQGISVTALQVVRAVAAIANGGKLMEPHVVQSIEDNRGSFDIKPRILDWPISEESAKQVKELMIQAVDKGEAQFYKKTYGLSGYRIAGKTGTAQIPVAGHYDPDKTIASFVGFAPADDPKFVMLVRYDQPTSSIYGADTAAPTFFDVAKELFLYYGIVPTEP